MWKGEQADAKEKYLRQKQNCHEKRSSKKLTNIYRLVKTSLQWLPTRLGVASRNASEF